MIECIPMIGTKPVYIALLFLFAGAGACWPAPILPDDRLAPPRNEVLFLGDSLTAGAGLAAQEAYPSVIGSYWARHEIPLVARNAGIGGDTTRNILLRLDAALSERTGLVFLAVGSNDGFLRRDVRAIQDDLVRIVQRLKERGIKVVLAEIWLPAEVAAPTAYRQAFDAMYAKVGSQFGLPVMPYFLRSLVTSARYWQSDGLHPTAEGDRLIARDILAFLNPSWRLE